MKNRIGDNTDGEGSDESANASDDDEMLMMFRTLSSDACISPLPIAATFQSHWPFFQ